MSNIDIIYEDINSFGSVGIKKSELKKRYTEETFEESLDQLVVQDKICVSKKGTYIYCWGKNFYLEYLLSSDIKFKYLYDSIIGIQNKLNNYSDSIFKYVEKIDCELSEVKNSFIRIEEKIGSLKTDTSNTNENNSIITLDEFKEQFDSMIAEKSSSIGWLELSSIKDELCDKCNITNTEFYSLVSDLIESFPEKYELSSGGYEGVVLRGIIHGFVRCI
ncbi:MAG TPA: hypothetical protein VJR94_12725 [Candidatus Nitrosocosmicus sp.]|nr:hypothetical protein [Candidatus Nitrosocosmicus sp.]